MPGQRLRGPNQSDTGTSLSTWLKISGSLVFLADHWEIANGRILGISSRIF
jgi:hypothetical protein